MPLLIPNSIFSGNSLIQPFGDAVHSAPAPDVPFDFEAFLAAKVSAGFTYYYYNVGDINTLFQLSAGTSPVTTFGQPIGRWLDKGPNAAHLQQSTTSRRPTYQNVFGKAYATFDGLDDLIQNTGMPFSTKRRATLLATFTRSLSAPIVGNTVACLGTAAGVTSTGIEVRSPNLNTPGPNSNSSGGRAAYFAPTSYLLSTLDTVDPVSHVGSISVDTASAFLVSAKLDRQPAKTANIVAGDYYVASTNGLFVGRRATSTNLFTGSIRSVLLLDAILTPREIQDLHTYLANDAGITI